MTAALAWASAAEAQLLREPGRGEAVERHLPGEIKPTQWMHDPALRVFINMTARCRRPRPRDNGGGAPLVVA